jgi:hypothetical protein
VGEAEEQSAKSAKCYGLFANMIANTLNLNMDAALSALRINVRTVPGPLARAITFSAFGAPKQNTENH